ncbi:MAG: hypothetical protein PHC61_17505, partial [Chitinivibrionales bacterium]|nr:hypothetical protein [Chitinivibrionales bacterium]
DLTGYYRIYKSANIQKLHVRYLTESACFDLDECMALRADEVYFVAIEDAVAVTKEMFKSWGFDSKITKQTRILLSAEQVEAVVGALKSKPDRRDAFSAETKRLMPRDMVEDAEALVLEDAENDPSAQQQNANENETIKQE